MFTYQDTTQLTYLLILNIVIKFNIYINYPDNFKNIRFFDTLKTNDL